MSSSRSISPRAALREQILRETLTLRADLRAEEGQVDTLTAYRKEMEKEETKNNEFEASSSSGFRGFFKKRLSSISTLHSSISTSIADEVAITTADSSDSLAQIPTHICSSPRRRSSLFSQDSRRSSISDGNNSCSTYRASRRRSSLFAYDDLVQEKSSAEESSDAAAMVEERSTIPPTRLLLLVITAGGSRSAPSSFLPRLDWKKKKLMMTLRLLPRKAKNLRSMMQITRHHMPPFRPLSPTLTPSRFVPMVLELHRITCKVMGIFIQTIEVGSRARTTYLTTLYQLFNIRQISSATPLALSPCALAAWPTIESKWSDLASSLAASPPAPGMRRVDPKATRARTTPSLS